MTSFHIFVLIAVFLFLCPAAHAQIQKTDVLAQCREKVIRYSDWPKVKDPVWSMDLKTIGGGRLFYFGAGHSRDAADPQFDAIESAWKTVRPTIAFYEGPNRPVADTREETIKTAGESGFVRYLAKRDGIPFVTLEPAPPDEVEYILRQGFTREQVLLFFVLRETARLREREKLKDAELQKTVAQILARAAQFKGFEKVITSLDELDAAYRRYWKTPSNWWEAPQKWFDPGHLSEETGGIFTNDINRASSHYRDLHMYEILSKAALEGKTVFAVVGRHHVPMQAPALECALRPGK